MAMKAAAQTNVERLIEAYLENSVRARKLRSARSIERTLRREVIPTIGRVSLAELHRRDINRVLDNIMARGKNVAACRCYTMMRAMFAWSVSRGDFETNIMEKVQRPPDYTPRNRVLSVPEIKTFWTGLEDAFAQTGWKLQAPSLARILRLCLVTAARVGEVAGMARTELDLESKVWRLPAQRSKNKFEHVLPLSSLALQILEHALTECGDSVFVNAANGKPFTTNRVTSAVVGLPDALQIPHFTSHDLRRSAADHMADLGISHLTIGHILNHRSITRATVTQRHYVVRNYEREARQALEIWADRIREIVTLRQ